MAQTVHCSRMRHSVESHLKSTTCRLFTNQRPSCPQSCSSFVGRRSTNRHAGCSLAFRGVKERMAGSTWPHHRGSHHKMAQAAFCQADHTAFCAAETVLKFSWAMAAAPRHSFRSTGERMRPGPVLKQVSQEQQGAFGPLGAGRQ